MIAQGHTITPGRVGTEIQVCPKTESYAGCMGQKGGIGSFVPEKSGGERKGKEEVVA